MSSLAMILWVVLRWVAVAFVLLCLYFIFKSAFKGKARYKVGEIITINGIPLEILEVKYSNKAGWYYCFLYKGQQYFYSQKEIEKHTKK